MQPGDKPLLQVEDLTVSFRTEAGPVAVVRNLNFEVGAGETLLMQLRSLGGILSSRAFWRYAPQTALIVGGFMTHMCVSATVRAATDQGFMSTIAADTVATRDLPDATGGDTIAAEVINRITLAALSDRFAWIVPSARQIA